MSRIGACNLHLHVGDSLSARAYHELLPRSIADDGGALGGSISHGVGEVDLLEELLHILVEGGSSDDDLVEVATEGVHHLFTYAFVHPPVDDRHLAENLNAVGLYLREHLLLDDFLDDEWNGDDDRWLDVGKRLCDDGRAGHTSQEEDVLTREEFEGELECHSIHVGEWQDADDVGAFQVLTHCLAGEIEVAPQSTIWNHHALREACRSTGVVDESQLVGVFFMVVRHVLLAEILWVLLAEHLIQVLAGIGQLVGARHNQRVVGDVDDALKSRHLCSIDDCCNHVANEQYLRIGVVHDVVNLVGGELVEDGYGNGAIGECGQESHRPTGTITTAKGYLVALHHTAVLEHDVQFLYLPCHVMVLQGCTLVIGQSVKVPMVDDAFFDQRVKAWYRFHIVILLYSDTNSA